MVDFNRYLIVIVGPTAVGKTELCINLAKIFNTEIISCDSRQFFRETKLGTAKPTAGELAQVKHHFIDSLSIQDSYDVKSFEKDALVLLEDLHQKHKLVIMTGGSGMYVDAICNGFDDIPDINSAIRFEIISDYEKYGLEFLQNEVEKYDPFYFQQVDRQNPQRLMRALEVIKGTGKTFSSFRVKRKTKRPFQIIKIGLELDREVLYNRIDLRMDLMIESGLFEEAETLYPFRTLNALQTVGYTEIFGYLEGKYDKEEAVRLLKRNSRRYAKRQMTWFRKDEEIKWFYPNQEQMIHQYILNQIG
ncbi:tRNA (adenosine(37)-N6)-dimethylallyltransferase MiaA [Belliella alkalica]|uniref:tRNA (adenosine(37)-N6)-dimethylallyltransferase MiaA n=1 Tax=Belliella alkalica TaxID=1730871 RepID=UPI00210264A2|nr:tRNA (adenosine(37)-N6)-dimethylallyltransferase MiaA [Belliella alkalica]